MDFQLDDDLADFPVMTCGISHPDRDLPTMDSIRDQLDCRISRVGAA